MKYSPSIRKQLRFQRNILSAALNGKDLEVWNGQSWVPFYGYEFDFQCCKYRTAQESKAQRITLDGKEYEIRLLLS